MRGRKPDVQAGPGEVPDDKQIPTRPKSLMGKPAAISEWKRIIRELYRRGLWDKSDLKVVELYCNAVHDYTEADKCVQDHGLLVADKGGGQKSNPAARMKRDAEDRMSRYLNDMGLTAVSAIRIGLDMSGDEDELDKLIKRRMRGRQ